MNSGWKTLQLVDHFSEDLEERDGDQHRLVPLAWMLNSYWPQEPQRISNELAAHAKKAISFLMECDASRVHSVKTVLSIAAIEALLPRAPNTTENVAQCVSAVLQPDESQWDKARRAVRRLYDERSHVVHGRDAASNLSTSDAARKLAAGVLHGLYSWWDGLIRMEGRGLDNLPSKADWSKELESAVKARRQVMFVPERLSKCLPTNG
jgi:hypothetical protein